MHASKKTQIAYLKANEAPIEMPSEYAYFANIFPPKLATKLVEHTEINNHAIGLVDNPQHAYGSIYSLGLVELETLKAYIKNNKANGFIRPFKSPARAPIFFDKKLRIDIKILTI